MKFNVGFGRPSTHWCDFDGPVTTNISPAHQHEFGVGFDLQYKNAHGQVVGRIDGLRPDEASFLKKKHGL